MKGRVRVSIEQAFQKHLQSRYSLRLHMFAILLATTLSGIFFSKILIFFGIVDFRVRYPVAVVLSYLIFFACIKLWLLWIASVKDSGTSTDYWPYLVVPSPGSDVDTVLPSVEGGGGEFSGGGASGSFDGPEKAVTGAAVLADSSPAEGGSTSGGIGGAVGDAAGALGDDNIVVAVVVLVVLVAVILGSTVLLLYSAPTILAEAAFQGILAASLIKRTRTMSDSAWAGSIFKATWKPFAVTLVVAFFAGMVFHSYFPNAVRLMDILWKG